MRRPKKRGATSHEPPKDKMLATKAAAYLELVDRIKALTVNKDALKQELNAYLNNVPNNFASLRTQYGSQVEIAHTIRSKYTLVPDALEQIRNMLTQEQLEDSKVIETVSVIREDLLEQLVISEELTEGGYASLYDCKESKVLSVKVIKEDG